VVLKQVYEAVIALNVAAGGKGAAPRRRGGAAEEAEPAEAVAG
jgi:hypothetical protein